MTASNENQPGTSDNHKQFYGYGRSALAAQCWATFAVSLTYVGNGIMLLVPTIVVGNVLDSKYDTLPLNEEEASWFGSIPALLQPVGSFLGILLLDFYSQRYGLLLANTLGLVSLLILYYASAASTALLSSVIMGLGLGLTAPSGMGYISEFSEPKFRGSLSFSVMFQQNTGMLVFCCVASIVDWRTLLLISAIIPVLAVILLRWIPNSPIWLLSKGRNEEAMKALMWFRGCLREEDAKEEFDDLKNYVKTSLTYNRAADAEQTSLLAQGNKSNLWGLVMSVLERRTLYPLFLMIVFSLILCIAGAIGASVYSINFFESLQLPYDSYFLLFDALFACAAGSLICIFMLRYLGKRNLSLLAVFLTALMTICTSIFIHYKDELQMPSIYVVILFLEAFVASQAELANLAIAGEIFSVRTRHAGTGLSGAVNGIFRFLFIKTYFATIHSLGYELYFLVCGVLGMIGCLYLFLVLPETEGKSLIEIEDMFMKTSDTEASELTPSK